MAAHRKKNQMRWAVSIFIASVGLLVGGLGIIPRCDSIQLKAQAETAHNNIKKKIQDNKVTNDKEHQRIYEQLKNQGDRMERHYESQQKTSAELQKTLWSVYREVKK